MVRVAGMVDRTAADVVGTAGQSVVRVPGVMDRPIVAGVDRARAIAEAGVDCVSIIEQCDHRENCFRHVCVLLG
jgi:hypothetical protein